MKDIKENTWLWEWRSKGRMKESMDKGELHIFVPHHDWDDKTKNDKMGQAFITQGRETNYMQSCFWKAAGLLDRIWLCE